MSANVSALSSQSPARWGAYLGLFCGCTCLVYGASTLGQSRPLPYSIAFLLCGVVELATCWFTIFRRRIAWSFAVSLNGTGALIFLFAIPKVRDGFGVPAILAVLPFFVLTLTTILLSLGNDEY